jgi:UPF0271 protein
LSLDNASSRSKLAIVLDTGALIAKYYRLLPKNNVLVYTVQSAVEEVVDRENREALLEAMQLGLINVVEPSREYLNKVREKAREIGGIHRLSMVDVDIASIALQLASMRYHVVVITDDYELQNLLLYMNISFKPLRTRGISEFRKYRAYCPVCGYIPGSPMEDECPLCGSRIKRKRI